MQHVTSLSFLLLAYSNYLSHANKVVPCGETSASPALLKTLAKRQVKLFYTSSGLLFMKHTPLHNTPCRLTLI